MANKHFTMNLNSDGIAIVTFKNKNLEMNVLEKEALVELVILWMISLETMK